MAGAARSARWRRTAARGVAALVLAGGTVPMLSGTAWACSCARSSSEEEQYRARAREAEVIYTAMVTDERRPANPDGQTPVRYTMVVEESLKGGASGSREVTTSDSGASCGLDLTPDKRALVVEWDGGRTVNLCDGTTQERVDQRAAIVRDELRRQAASPSGSPRPSLAPTTPPGGPSLPHTGGGAVAGGALLTAVLAGAAAAYRWNRRLT